MAFLFHLAFLLTLTSCATHGPRLQNELLYQTPPAPWQLRLPAAASFLSLNLPYESFAALRKDIEVRNNLQLKNRGEAHITLITPPEMKILNKKISANRIFQIAESMRARETPFTALCVGKAEVPGEEQKLSTYFVVVESEGLFKIRQKIQEEFIKSGGKRSEFDPDLYFPHVTLGFSERDLHYEEGAVKDASSCLYSLKQL